MKRPRIDWRALSLGERFHLGMIAFWVALIPPSVIWWKESVPYLVFLSVASLIIGHISAYQGAKAERNSPDA